MEQIAINAQHAVMIITEFGNFQLWDVLAEIIIFSIIRNKFVQLVIIRGLFLNHYIDKLLVLLVIKRLKMIV